jgi:hypothetical protein
MTDPQPIEIEAAEVERLIEQAQHGRLDPAAQKRIVPLLQTLLWLEHTLLETRISLAKLRKLLFGKRTEKTRRKPSQPPDGPAGSSENAEGQSDPPSDPEPPAGDAAAGEDGRQSEGESDTETGSGEQTGVGSDGQKPTPRPGHGRLGAADYPGAERIFCPHDQYQAGDRCPNCTRGRLYRSRSLVRLRFRGLPLAQVMRYELEKLRCGACGALLVAHMPPEAGQETYDVSLKVHLAVAHYHLGLPLKRIESFQQLVGMPLPDATQWELVEQVADSAYPPFEYLKHFGAQQPRVYQDDTGTRILSLIKENQADPPPARKGMYTTVLRFEGEHAICLYFTGRRHAGENLDGLLADRDPRLPPIQWMSDGLAANTPKEHKDQAVDLSCLVHGRRQFVDIEAFFPGECARVIDAIATIYQHEAHCKDQQLTPAQRLAYHQEHSREVMEALKTWMEQRLEERLVEPNSRLGGAFEYLLKRWKALTRFLHIAGAPLDNNAAERALKIILRYRKNSLFYKNAHGAHVGDVLTSLIETCRLAGANPLDYLRALMENRSAVFADPAAWLPWNYRAARQPLERHLPLSHPPPVLGHPGLLGVAVP